MSIILRACNVSFKDILNYPEIEIQEKKATFINGASGCGKSTLFRLFNATQSPDSGSIIYDGKDIETFDTISLRQQILLVGQSVYLFDGTIQDNFNQFYSFRQVEPLSEDKMSYFLSLSCCDFSLKTDCSVMSGGERQRIFLAICISFMPKVLMLDEPTSALDSVSSNQLLFNMKNFCEEHQITLLVISHDKTLTEKYADEIITIERSM